MRIMGSRSESCDIPLDECAELEYDMWDGQFDFVGPQGKVHQDDGLEDLFEGPLTPHLHTGTNGAKKNVAHHWYDNITDQVQLLQQQVTNLADTQNTADDRYTRAKSDNAVLQARVHILEEQLREIEVRCDERIAEEQRRCRESIARIERDRDTQIETLNNRLTIAESEAGNLKQEVGRLRGVSEGLRVGADAEAQRFREAQETIATLTLQLKQSKENLRKEKDAHTSTADMMRELQLEYERLKSDLSERNIDGSLRNSDSWENSVSPDLLRLEELHQDLNRLRQENKDLSEAHEELQAQILTKGLETGRSLLGPPPQASLAAELTEMSTDQFDGIAQDHYTTQYDKMQKALKEQQEVNLKLRCYIDGILLNIVENHPQLLEVKHKSSS